MSPRNLSNKKQNSSISIHLPRIFNRCLIMIGRLSKKTKRQWGTCKEAFSMTILSLVTTTFVMIISAIIADLKSIDRSKGIQPSPFRLSCHLLLRCRDIRQQEPKPLAIVSLCYSQLVLILNIACILPLHHPCTHGRFPIINSAGDKRSVDKFPSLLISAGKL